MSSTFKGFMAGSLALIILYVVGQPGASAKSAQASNFFVAGIRRLFSPEVAGIGDHSKTSQTGASGDGGSATPKSAAESEAPQGMLFTA